MRPYEVMLILDSTVEETTVESTVDQVKDLVKGKGGTVGQVEKWGRRRFAYELKHRWEGYYTLIEFNAEPTAVADLDRLLLLSDDIVRHKIVRIPEAVAGRPRPAAKPESAPAEESTGA